MNRLMLVAGLCVVAGAASPLAAQEKKGSNAADAATTLSESGKAVEQIALAYKLADYARSQKDGHAMLLAANMVSKVTIKPGTETGKVEGAGAASAAAGTAKVKSASDLYAEARTLAAGNQDLLDEIQAAQSSASKGAVGGAIGVARYVPSNTVWSLRFAARGGEPLLVGVERDSPTPIDLKVYDENNNLLCQDNSHSVFMTCRVTPAWTGPFRIDVVNHGASGSGIALLTN